MHLRRIAISGGREFTDQPRIIADVEAVERSTTQPAGLFTRRLEVVHGANRRGADAIADKLDATIGVGVLRYLGDRVAPYLLGAEPHPATAMSHHLLTVLASRSS